MADELFPSRHKRKAPKMSPYQRKVMATIRERKAEVYRGRSVFSDLDWSGTRCNRCAHYCAGRHHPGSMGKCPVEGCQCQYATVLCECKHTSAEHEPFGVETKTNCGVCSCVAFGAMYTQFSITGKENP